jgi:hypothetical protein
MKLRIIVDSLPHEIDSTDPELLGKWVAEIFGRAAAFGITAATQIQVQVYPSWIPTADKPGGSPDWIADSRIIGNYYQVSSPHDLVAILAQQIADAEAMAHGSSDH